MAKGEREGDRLSDETAGNGVVGEGRGKRVEARARGMHELKGGGSRPQASFTTRLRSTMKCLCSRLPVRRHRPTSRLSLPLLHPPFTLALSRFVTRFRAYHLSAASQTKDQACAYAATKDQVHLRIFRHVFPFVLRFEI